MSQCVVLLASTLLTIYLRRAEAERQLDGEPDPEDLSDNDEHEESGLTTGDTAAEVKSEPAPEPEPEKADVSMGD